MTTLAFVVWVIGWPASYQWALVYSKKCGLEYTDDERGFGALFGFAIWVGIAVLLWFHR